MADIERKLATVRRIAAIDPIEGADKIVCVTVDGWKLVSAKDNGFQVGSLVLYFEIDSFLPVRPEFEWMRERCYKNIPGLGEGFRVKTIKLRGQVSQGLIVPLSDFLDQDEDGNWYYYKPEIDIRAVYVDEGSDLTELLGVKKYEKPIPAALAGRVKGNFPSFIRKTDQERVQNCLGGVKKWIFQGTPIVEEVTDEVFLTALESGKVVNTETTQFFKSGDKWFIKVAKKNTAEEISKRNHFEATLKLDGSSITIYYNEGQIGVCSRNLELKRDPDNAFWNATIASGILHFLIDYGRNIAIQGELMGPGVQDNREGLESLRIYMFDAFDIDQQRYFTPEERDELYTVICESGYATSQFMHVPNVHFDLELPHDVDVNYFLDLADKQKSIRHDIAEGIVFKSHVENGPTFKVISNKFLLKEKD